MKAAAQAAEAAVAAAAGQAPPKSAKARAADVDRESVLVARGPRHKPARTPKRRPKAPPKEQPPAKSARRDGGREPHAAEDAAGPSANAAASPAAAVAAVQPDAFLRSWAWKREHRPDRDRFEKPYVHAMRVPPGAPEPAPQQAAQAQAGAASRRPVPPSRNQPSEDTSAAWDVKLTVEQVTMYQAGVGQRADLYCSPLCSCEASACGLRVSARRRDVTRAARLFLRIALDSAVALQDRRRGLCLHGGSPTATPATLCFMRRSLCSKAPCATRGTPAPAPRCHLRLQVWDSSIVVAKWLERAALESAAAAPAAAAASASPGPSSSAASAAGASCGAASLGQSEPAVASGSTGLGPLLPGRWSLLDLSAGCGLVRRVGQLRTAGRSAHRLPSRPMHTSAHPP
jgi:hypothetical protein